MFHWRSYRLSHRLTSASKILKSIQETIEIVIIIVPIVGPVLLQMDIDPIWLGVVVTIMIEVGMLTPPVGMNLFVLVGISKHQVSLAEASVGALPFWLLLLLGVALLTLVPGLATWLPSLSYGA